MEQPRRAWSVTISAIATVIGVIFLLSSFSWVPSSVLAPFVGPQRFERPTDGYAISFPLDWEYAVAAEADPDEWWDSDKVDDLDKYHEEFLTDGGLLLARPSSPLAPLEWCELSDVTSFAAMFPAWSTLGDAETYFMAWEDDPANTAVGVVYLDLPAGRALSIESRWQYGESQQDQQDYVHTDGEQWFRLHCGTDITAPDDRWLPIAETFEFLSSTELEVQSDEREAPGDAWTVVDELRSRRRSPSPSPGTS